jgi:hypothetical protein
MRSTTWVSKVKNFAIHPNNPSLENQNRCLEMAYIYTSNVILVKDMGRRNNFPPTEAPLVLCFNLDK